MVSRKRILFVSHDFTMTGAPIVLFNLLIGLKDHFEISVVAPGDGLLRAHYQRHGIDASVVDGLLRDMKIAAEVVSPFDCVVGNSILSFMAIQAAHQAGKKSIWYLHEGLIARMFFKAAPQLAATFSLNPEVIVPCEFSQKLYAPLLKGPSALVPYGVEHFPDAPSPILQPSGAIQLLQLGAFGPRKAQDVSLAAMRILKNEPFKLNIVGGVVAPDYFRAMLAQFRDLAAVKIEGEVDIEQTASVIARSDILILTSHDEVTPMVILEAMALGRPVIASAVGGIPEMIEDGKTGFLFKDGDSVQLANLIRKLGADAALRAEVSQQAREQVRQLRTLESSRELFRNVIEAG